MRRYIVAGLLLVLLVITVPLTVAQENRNTSTPGGVVGITQPIAPNCVLEAPGRGTMEPGLVVIFENLNERLVVPRLDGSSFVLSCASNDEDAQLVRRSPSVPFGAIPPRPNNSEDVINTRDGYAIVNVYSANIRSCAEITCTQVALADGGDRLVVLGHNEDLSWWYVQAGETRGWISNEIVLLRGDLTDLPLVVTEGERPQPSVYVGFTGNPIYRELLPGSPIVCRVQGDSGYLLLGQSIDENYLKIEATCLDGSPGTGWIEANYAIIRNPGNVPIPVLQN
jgi:hypothetical protein